jgi:hypothetical protein
MVTKKDGATMTCQKCETDLICRLKDYGGNYPPSLQWQNFDGSAHYKTTDGKNFDCNIPEDDETGQTRIPTQPTIDKSGSITQSDFILLVQLGKKIDILLADVERLKDMITPMFQKMVDDQIGRNL